MTSLFVVTSNMYLCTLSTFSECFTPVYSEYTFPVCMNTFSAFSVSPAPIPLPGSFSEIEGEYEISGVLPAPVRKFAEVSDNTDICFWVLHNTIHVSVQMCG